MAMLTSDRTIRWIENLADQERLIREGERSTLDICITKDEVLSGETATFSMDLHHHFEYLVRLFNSRVQKPELELRIVRENGNAAGFSITRNSMKFMLSAPQAGRIQLHCHKLIGGGADSKSTVMFTGVIESKFGKFHDVEWYFLGTRVTAEQVARHYLTEFIQVSRTPAESN